MDSEEETWDYYQDKYRPLANALTKQLMNPSEVAQSLMKNNGASSVGGARAVCPTALALRRHGLQTLCTVRRRVICVEACQ
jgi:hypothetical protein